MDNDSFLTDDFLDMDSDNDIVSSNDDESRVLFGLGNDTTPAAKQPEPVASEDFIDEDEEEDEDDIVPVSVEEHQSKPRQQQRHNRGSFNNRMNHRSNASRRSQPQPEPEPDDVDDEDIAYEEENDPAVEPIVSLDEYKDDDDDVVPVEESPIEHDSGNTNHASKGVEFELIRKIIAAFIYCTDFTKDRINMTYSFMAAMAAMKKLTFNANDNSTNEIKIAAIIKTAIDLDDDVRTSVHNLIEAKNMDDSDRAFFLVGLSDRKKLDDIHIIMRTFSLVKNTDLPQDESFNNLAKMVDTNIKMKFIPNNKAVEMVDTIDKLLQKTKDISGDSDDSKAD